MGESSENDDLDFLETHARLESCKRNNIILTYTRQRWRSKTRNRNGNEQGLEPRTGNHSANMGKGLGFPDHETSHEQKKDEISSSVSKKGEANVSDDVQVTRGNLISAAASTSLGCWMAEWQLKKVPKATIPKIDIDVKSWDVPAPPTPDIVTRKRGKQMMSPGNCEPTEDVSREPCLAEYGKASAMEIEQSTYECLDSRKKTCRRSLRLDVRNLKRKARNDLVLDETDMNYTATGLNIDDNSASKASVLLSQVQEHDPKMTGKVHDAKDFGCPRSVHVYPRREQVKNPVQKKTKGRIQNRFICSSSLPDELKGPNKRVMKKMAKPVLEISNHPKIRKQSMTCIDEVSTKKPDSECNEESDKDEREWQKIEKESLRRQIKLFMSCMLCIQGERKFSQWKGSVMDSIGGAYLAQNANDALSSSAFMSLAAKFPREAFRVSSPAEASSSKMKNDKVVQNVKENKINAACSKNVQKRKPAEKDRCYNTRNSRRQRIKKKHDPVLLNVLKDCYSKYHSEKKTFEMSDAIDWDSVRMANVNDISDAIQIRGMNNNLAARIKNCVKNLVKNFGSTDMEWIRDVPCHKAKEYLLSIYGLGLKSVECIRLLTLRQKAFPIDRNAGRVAVRLGWVPLEQLPEGEEFHLLKLKEYPKVNSIQTYLWLHLSDLDSSILYELHCQMITFGKVFCTQSNPNCYECPMRAECKHFACVLASAELAPISKQDRSSKHPSKFMALVESLTVNESVMVKVPGMEIKSAGLAEMDIEDYGLIVNPGTRFHDMQKSMSKKNIPLEEGELSSNLLAYTSEIASIPVVKKKNAASLRTEHKVYVLPDDHDVLAELESRELDDPCPYLLAVWTYTPESLEKDEHIPEDEAVYGTLLIPARTATRGIFPLNGTFFQANEVFADDESSEVQIKVPRASLMNLSYTILYCGSSTSMICRGMTSAEVQNFFKRGFVCFRGLNRKTREPKPLPARFHLPASKAEKPRSMKIKNIEENDA